MATQALYRRYRSQTFDELVGQEHIVRTLRNAIVDGRIGHAYLFTGPRGVGKTTVARLLAKAVNCLAEPSERPCGTCNMCVSTAEGSAVDVIEMDAASHTSVDDAREIIERVQFRPALGRYKVYIIDEVHMLSTAAFNALLKTLEEPPNHAIFVLATTEIHKVPATILSRCQRYTFNRHNVSDTVNHLRQIAITEGYHIEAGVAEAIARAATGSMRDALSIFDQLMSYGSGQVSMAMVQGLLGVTAAQEVITLAEALLNSDVAAALQVVARVASQGADMRQFSRDIVQHLRLVMLVKADPNGTAIEAAESEADAVRDQARRAQMGSLVYWLRRMSELDYELRTSPYGQLPLELAVVEAIAGPPVSSAAPSAAPVSRPVAPPSAAPARPSASEMPRPSVPPAPQPTAPQPTAPQPTAPTPATPRPVAPSDAPATPPSRGPSNEPAANPPTTPLGDKSPIGDVTDLLERWPAIIRDLRSKSRNLEALIKSGIAPIDIQGTVITLKADNEWLLNKIQERNNVTILEEVIARYAGVSYTIRSVAEAAKRDSGSALREQIRDTTTNPLVRAAMNVFDADVVSIETPEQGETA
ncbi:MAG: DNA polymerase III subunit gamma/tau [Chloroflexi bacterium]|nr:MAG: DNA polymerase III subunit gamma/tau [Chloroflexota bacterium]